MDTVKKRQEDATSKETLEDLEKESPVDTDSANENDGPSPDGAFVEEDKLTDADLL